MADFQLVMPKMGESIMEATILKWLKNEGDDVEIDETILEIATDKVDSEIPSPVSGKLTKVLFNEDESVPVGTAIAVIETSDVAEEGLAVSPLDIEPLPVASEEPKSNGRGPLQVSPGKKLPPVYKGRFYSPLVRKIATEEGVTLAELGTIDGTGLDGRVTKRDILSFLDDRVSSDEPSILRREIPVPGEKSPAEVDQKVPVVPPKVRTGRDEIVQMDRMRKIIAEHMVTSKKIAPHVTSFVEADVTDIVKWREEHKAFYLEHHSTKLTYTPIFIQAVTKAIIDFPQINSSLVGDEIIFKKDINIGMATALPTGNLIVPVIKNADEYNLIGLAKQVNRLADRARQNNLTADEISGGTFTLTNVGIFGNVMGTPIINQPQSAILATGTIQKKPAVVETQYGDLVAIRHKMFLSLSYDHRFIDGFLGGSFLRKVADYLEQFGHEDVI
ncbi:MAG: 2-oxo acid dehydrogenase subunit E2 [Saprospiraceae bacterium]|nr:2-oxo acid dehydrogenase subunit E2 [Saprospiraceae bacterium]